jgi:hypothetical protein
MKLEIPQHIKIYFWIILFHVAYIPPQHNVSRIHAELNNLSKAIQLKLNYRQCYTLENVYMVHDTSNHISINIIPRGNPQVSSMIIWIGCCEQYRNRRSQQWFVTWHPVMHIIFVFSLSLSLSLTILASCTRVNEPARPATLANTTISPLLCIVPQPPPPLLT